MWNEGSLTQGDSMGSLSFVVTSKEGYAAAAPLFEVLGSARRSDSELILLTAADCSADAEILSSRGIRAVEVPGASLFDLRSRIPMACRKDWVFLVEDHAMLDRRAIDAAYRLIEQRPELDLIAVVGKNLTSVTAWGWANFIQTFAFHWAPLPDRPGSSLATNVIVRRSKLGNRALAAGQWEFSLIPGIYKTGRVGFSNEVSVDHIKHVDLVSAFALNFHNGRACAGVVGGNGRSVGSSVRSVRRAWRSYRRRQDQMRAKIAMRSQELPAGLGWRLRIIGMAHLLGTVAGSCFGGGKSIQILD